MPRQCHGTKMSRFRSCPPLASTCIPQKCICLFLRVNREPNCAYFRFPNGAKRIVRVNNDREYEFGVAIEDFDAVYRFGGFDLQLRKEVEFLRDLGRRRHGGLFVLISYVNIALRRIGAKIKGEAVGFALSVISVIRLSKIWISSQIPLLPDVCSGGGKFYD
jgi:hypothetical protein